MISEVIYGALDAHSDTVDPQRFLLNYLNRRKNDTALQGAIVVPATDATSTTRSAQNDNKGFTQVVKKKPAKKSGGERSTGAPVGVGGRTVVGATRE